MTQVQLDHQDGLAVVTLNNPSGRNAITADMAHELVRICDRIDEDLTLGAVVIRGAGGYFCSGGHQAELGRISDDPLSESSYAALSTIYAAFVRFGALKVPTIAAVRGGAVGAGFNLALAADVCIIGEDALVASAFTRLGVHPGGGHYWLLNKAGGARTAALVGLFGERVDGRRAVELGLATESCRDDAVEERAITMANHVARDPALSRHAKASLVAETQPAIPWSAAVEVERGRQLWSLARKGGAGWRGPERAVN